jgi:hypothetical protein
MARQYRADFGLVLRASLIECEACKVRMTPCADCRAAARQRADERRQARRSLRREVLRAKGVI